MEAQQTRAFGPARIVALAIVAVAALGLAYLHFGTGSAPLLAIAGAAIGANLAVLALDIAWGPTGA